MAGADGVGQTGNIIIQGGVVFLRRVHWRPHPGAPTPRSPTTAHERAAPSLDAADDAADDADARRRSLQRYGEHQRVAGRRKPLDL